MKAIDICIQSYFSGIRTEGLTEAMILISKIFDFTFYFVCLALALALLIYLSRGIKCTVLFISSLLFGGISVYILKTIFDIARPTDYVISAFGQSFPSYHATIVTIFFGVLMYIFDDYFPSGPRVLFNSLCISIILLVGFSRIYLGAHWFSDVLVGILLGALISYISIWLFRNVTNEDL